MSDLLYSEIEDDLRAERPRAARRRGALDGRARRDRDGRALRRGAVARPRRRAGAGRAGRARGRSAAPAPAWRETAVVLEELGRSARAGAVPGQRGRRDGRAARPRRTRDLLARLAAGEQHRGRWRCRSPPGRSAPAVPDRRRRPADRRGHQRGRRAGRRRAARAGRRRAVRGGAAADGATRTAVVSLDLTRPLADVTLRGVAGRLVAAATPAAAARRALTGRRGAARLRAARRGRVVPGRRPSST